MAIESTYTAGTASVAAGSTAVSGQGTAWTTAGLQAGDRFWAGGIAVRIAAIVSATALTLAYPWPGATLSAGTYEIVLAPDTSRVQATTMQLLATLADGKLASMAAQTVAADRMLYATGPTTFAVAVLTPFARTILDDADGAAVRGTIGLGTMATQGASGIAVTGGSMDGVAIGSSARSSGRFTSIFTNADMTIDKVGTDAAPFYQNYNGSFSWSKAGVGGALQIMEDRSLNITGVAYPTSDNAYSLGKSSNRWSVVYSATGTISTSDSRDKKKSRFIKGEEALGIVNAVRPLLYRWKVGGRSVEAVQAKNKAGELLWDEIELPDADDAEAAMAEARPLKMRVERRARMVDEVTDIPGKRLHAGWYAQDVRAALETAGIDCAAWGLDDAANPDSRQFIRPDQMMAFLWAAVAELSARLDKATAKAA